MHRSQTPADTGCSEFEIEMRTRFWCSTILWDWYVLGPLAVTALLTHLEANVGVAMPTYARRAENV